jgi:2-keto-4-pentenoate hydratase/2-oxohepta-3-ene-1,7-dioic acid hydratase in catechol pathway
VKFLRYRKNNEEYYGILENNQTIRRLQGPYWEEIRPQYETDNLEDVIILAPVVGTRLFGVGLNYAAHAAESNQEPPPQPMLFMLPPTAIIGPDEPIIYPQQGKRVDFEGELAVVIGKHARRIDESEALDVVFGYTCGNDVSERIIQAAEMKEGCLLIGKGFDTFKPLGPWIESELDPGNQELITRVNGEIRQHTHTSDLIYSVAKLIAYLSAAITLLPGDVIMTGTPSGIGPVRPGDEIEIEISGIGVLRNQVIAETAS